MKYLVVLVACLAYASATEIKLEQAEERIISSFIQTTDGYTYLGLNATYLWGAVGVAAVLGVVMLVMASGVLPEAAQKIQRYGQEFSDDIFVDPEQEDVQNRYRRSIADHDIASKMAQLEQAFKKYQVTEAECEMYIACEASQVNRHEENGPLAKIIFDIISTFNRAKDSNKWDDRMEGLVQAFEYGTGAQAAGQVDACEPLRNKCFELHASTKY